MLQEIVAIRFGDPGIISNIPAVIIGVVQSGDQFELLTRKRMQLMASFDFGEKWVKLSKSRTLFLWDDQTGELFEGVKLNENAA